MGVRSQSNAAHDFVVQADVGRSRRNRQAACRRVERGLRGLAGDRKAQCVSIRITGARLKAEDLAHHGRVQRCTVNHGRGVLRVLGHGWHSGVDGCRAGGRRRRNAHRRRCLLAGCIAVSVPLAGRQEHESEREKSSSCPSRNCVVQPCLPNRSVIGTGIRERGRRRVGRERTAAMHPP